jgi:flagellar motor component MotA
VELIELKNTTKKLKVLLKNSKNSEKAYNDILDDVDKFYNVLKRDGFKALNDFNDINEELRKYNASVKGFKDNSTEMLKAVDDWKSIPSKFKKIK